MMLRTFSFFIFLLFLSCTNQVVQPSKNRAIEDLYQSAGAEQYFLADLPKWANFSASSGCHRKNNVRFLNFEALSQNMSFDYYQLTQFQYMMNRRSKSYLTSSGLDQLKPKDEAYIFYNVMDNIKGGASEFLVPKFKKIQLIWIDEALGNTQKISKLRKYLKSEKSEFALPIVISNCLSSLEIENFIAGELKQAAGFKYISNEIFSPYTTETKLGTDFYLNVTKLFGENYDITFVSFGDVPKSIIGDIKHYKLK